MEGLIHISEVGLDEMEWKTNSKSQEDVTAKIIKVDRDERKIALSLREHQHGFRSAKWTNIMRARGWLDQSLGRAAKKNGSGEAEEE